MKAAPAAQQQLLELQAIDTAIAQLEHRRRTLPELAGIAEGSKERARLIEELVAARTIVGDLQLELDKAEADLIPVKERRARDQRLLDDGSITDPRQLQSLLEEIEHLKRRIFDLEDIQLEVMEKLDEATVGERQLGARKSELEDSLRTLIISRDSQLRDLSDQLDQRASDRQQVAVGVPEDLVALYQRIAARGGGVGAARLNGRRCSGCQLEATGSVLKLYTDAPADEVLRCEECNRILVRGS